MEFDELVASSEPTVYFAMKVSSPPGVGAPPPGGACNTVMLGLKSP